MEALAGGLNQAHKGKTDLQRAIFLIFISKFAINPPRENINTNKHGRIDDPHVL